MDTNSTQDPIQTNQPPVTASPPEPPTSPTAPPPSFTPGPMPTPPLAPPPPPPSQPGDFPGRTLGIVGFVLAFFFPLVGLILSVIAASKAKKAGVKFGLATAGIIVSAVFLFLGILFAVLVTIAAVKGVQECAGFGNTTVQCDTSQNGSQTGSASATTKTYTASTLSFQYPADWTQVVDTSNSHHYFNSDGEYDTYDSFYSAAKIGSTSTSAAIAVYSVQKPKGSLPSASEIHAAAVTTMKANVEKMKTFDGSGRDIGHGCASNWKLTRAAAYEEVGQLVGMTYGYTCKSPYSGQIHGESGVWYDQNGAINRLEVTAVDSYYDANSAKLEAIIPSIRQ